MRAVPTRGGESSSELAPGGFSPLSHAWREPTRADTHVDSFGDVLSDAGSTPAASTILCFRYSLEDPLVSLECPSRRGVDTGVGTQFDRERR